MKIFESLKNSYTPRIVMLVFATTFVFANVLRSFVALAEEPSSANPEKVGWIGPMTGNLTKTVFQ